MSSTTSTKTATSSSKESLLTQLSSLVSSSEVISPSSPEYLANSQTWSHAHNQNPKLVVRPATLDSLSKVIAFLGKTDLDFKVRSHGYGNASAKDVLVSVTAFDEFEWDEEKKTVTLGAGANWALYYEKMAKVAPEYAIVCARTPSIGVGGSTLCSGFSWLSHERGCVSDPANMLDAQVVLIDGRVIWASEEPDLLWALRGTETGFAVVTKFKFQAFLYPQDGSIYAGPIFIPRDKVPEAAKGIASMVDQDINGGGADPKVGMFLYVMRKELLHLIGVDPGQDVLVIHVFDANGEAHGRETFKWALDIEGAIDQTRGNMTLKDVADMQAHIGAFRGLSTTYWSPLALTSPQLTEKVILNAVTWWTDILSFPGSLPRNSWLLLELFSCRDNLTGRESSAWPRPVGYKHLILIGAGTDVGAPEEELEMARQKVRMGPKEILGVERGDFVPNALQVEVGHDAREVYGANWERLRAIKRRFDPGMRLKGSFVS